MKKYLLLVISCIIFSAAHSEDGYRLWLRYDIIKNETLRQQYIATLPSINFPGNSATIIAAKKELTAGLEGLLGKKISESKANGGLIISTPLKLPLINNLFNKDELNKLGKEGFLIATKPVNSKPSIIITANTDVGILYGVFHFLRLLQTNEKLENLSIVSVPKIQHRLLNHWDNLNRSVERGYAGISIWDWHKLPDYIDQRYIDYARANASIGINGTVLTNVNANALVLTESYLKKVAALANTFRPYGIKVYLTARFSAPVEIGNLKTADPYDQEVKQWWKQKAEEIYKSIPDFGGFLVKANSEGQPGPHNYNRTHADGANMLADAVEPFGGIIMWRAFVYDARVQKPNENYDSSHTVDRNETAISAPDRFKQAYEQFKPLDGQFRKNVIIQVKNGPIDFQPREPFSPLFGAMPKTPLIMEFQLTQEYLGFATHIVFLPSLYKEVLDADTYVKGKNSFVKKVIDGSLHNYNQTGIAAVSNIGSDRNWTGHLFHQGNWYGYGRLAWDPDITEEKIAHEWIKQTFSNDASLINSIKSILLQSHDAIVNYMTPLGLHHIMANGHHYGPAPWSNTLPRADWNPVYYHKADDLGIGFDRTSKGSNALSQYAPEIKSQWENINSTPDEFLLWFHHVQWNHTIKSGRTLWEELCYKYNEGVDSIKSIQQQWKKIEGFIDQERFDHVAMLLNIQVNEAKWWRDACLLYFQTFSKQPIPSIYEQPKHSLEYYQSLRFPFAPGSGGNL